MADRAPSVQAPRADSRLETWKEIAAFLGRDIRTVQRWEKTEALPVHRHLHAKSATVYAHPAELDAWWDQRRPKLEVQEPPPRSHPTLIAAAVACAAVLALCAAGLWYLYPTPEPQPETRRLWTGPDTDHFGGVSADGRLFAFASRETDDLTVVDLATGRERQLTHKPPRARTGAVRAAAFSSDGSRIAFAWDEGTHVSIRLIGIDGSGERVLLREPSIRWVVLTWSPDGKYIVAAVRRAAVGSHIIAIDAATGEHRLLIDTRGQEVWRAEHSPDGRFLAFDVDRQIQGAIRRRVYIAPAAGGEAVPLADHDDNHYLLGWTQQGILFACDRTGATDGWSVPIVDGKPAGEPVLAMKGAGDLVSVGVSRSGSFYYGRRTSVADVYTAALEWSSGQLVSAPQPASVRYAGLNVSPDWSPDGKSLAYVPLRRRPNAWPSARLIVRTLTPPSERQADIGLESLEMLRWCPDGKSLLGVGFDHSAVYNLVAIDAATGATRVLTGSGQDRISFHEPICCSPARVLYKKRIGFTEPGLLMSLDVRSGREMELLPSVYRAALSRDGQRLLYSTFDAEREYIRLLPLDGSAPPVQVHSEPRAGRIVSVAWDPSGSHAIFAKRNKLWRVGLAGGEPREIPLTMEALRELRVHPDGRRIAFTGGSSAKGELWVWEHVARRD